MVHIRLNEKEPNPNPHVNFITALPSIDELKEESRQLLRALAAQVRPVMKKHGFSVNSLEEYEYNEVFAGRNWNAGETVELVLRRPGGLFYPNSWLMSTLCHELAHIKHMNHGSSFQALWRRLRTEVRQLQDKGYYGDGYWSSGTRLADSARIGGQGIEPEDFPEYMCGGAQSRTRPTSTRRRRTGGVARGKRREVVPSLHTGKQTAPKRKAGARVTSKYAFTGEGATLGADGKGTGFGKKAASKRAREERAMATERRLLALQGKSEPEASGSTIPTPDLDPDEGSDDEIEFVGETDAERREALRISEADRNLEEDKLGPRNSWLAFEEEFNFNNSGSRITTSDGEVVEISSDEGEEAGCDAQVASGSTFTTGSTSKGQGNRRESTADPWQAAPSSSGTGFQPTSSRVNRRTRRSGSLGLGRMVQTEIDLRKKESLGMAPLRGGGRTLGSKPEVIKEGGAIEPQGDLRASGGVWSCVACTLDNEPDHLCCAACATPQGGQLG